MTKYAGSTSILLPLFFTFVAVSLGRVFRGFVGRVWWSCFPRCCLELPPQLRCSPLFRKEGQLCRRYSYGDLKSKEGQFFHACPCWCFIVFLQLSLLMKRDERSGGSLQILQRYVFDPTIAVTETRKRTRRSVGLSVPCRPYRLLGLYLQYGLLQK